jgi:hypothetical protein
MDVPSGELSPDEEPICAVELYLPESERIEFQKCAERCGMSLSEWMRDRLNEALKREAKEA